MLYFMISVLISDCLIKSCIKSLPNILLHFDKLSGCQEVSSSETIGRFSKTSLLTCIFLTINELAHENDSSLNVRFCVEM